MAFVLDDSIAGKTARYRFSMNSVRAEILGDRLRKIDAQVESPAVLSGELDYESSRIRESRIIHMGYLDSDA